MPQLSTICNSCGDTFEQHPRQKPSQKTTTGQRRCPRRPSLTFVTKTTERAYDLPDDNFVQPMRRNAGDVYFKTVRLDGSAFKDAAISYRVGSKVKPARLVRNYLNPSGLKKMCGPGYVHASLTPGAALVAGKWPARLFLVEGVPTAGLKAKSRWKAGFDELKVLKELPAWRIFGKNGVAVVQFMEHMRTLRSGPRDVDYAGRTTYSKDLKLKIKKMIRENGYSEAMRQAQRYAPTATWSALAALMMYPLLEEDDFVSLYAHANIVKPLSALNLVKDEHPEMRKSD